MYLSFLIIMGTLNCFPDWNRWVVIALPKDYLYRFCLLLLEKKLHGLLVFFSLCCLEQMHIHYSSMMVMQLQRQHNSRYCYWVIALRRWYVLWLASWNLQNRQSHVDLERRLGCLHVVHGCTFASERKQRLLSHSLVWLYS